MTKRVLSAAKHAHTESERRVVVDSVMNVIGMEVSEKDSTLRELSMRITPETSSGFLSTVILMMSGWFLLLLLQSASSGGTRTTGCGLAIQVTSAFSVFMPTNRTDRRIIHLRTSLSSGIRRLLFHWMDIKEGSFCMTLGLSGQYGALSLFVWDRRNDERH